MKFKNLKYIFWVSPFLILTPLFIASCSNQISKGQTANNTFKIFHTNDIHGRLTESTAKYNEWMGLEKISTYVKNNKHDLLIDAGDLFQGLPISNLDNGKTATDISNYMGYDYKTIGNHEFDFGLDNLKALTGLNVKPKDDINYLANNIRLTADNNLLFKPYDIKLLNDIKIGVIGIATPETATKTHPKNVNGIKFTNPIDETKKNVQELTNQGIDIIIAISHLGLDKTSEFTSEKLANEVDGIDIIIDGHSHTTLENGKVISKPNQPNDTYIAQTGSYSQNLGQIDFKISNDKKSLTDVNISLINYKNINVNPDSNVQEMIKPLQEKYNTYSKEEAFNFPNNLDIKLISQGTDNQGNSIAETRYRETNLGDVFADSLVYDAKDRIAKNTNSNKPSQIDFAFINGGSFRANIDGTPVGNKKIVTNGDVDSTSPFGNTLEVLQLNSKTVWELFEHSIKKRGSGPFLQVSKEVQVTYEVDNSDISGEKNKVKALSINGTSIDKNDTTKMFYVATNDFLLAGGDGYSMLTEKSTGIQGESISNSFKIYGKYLSENETSTDNNIMKWANYKDEFSTNRIKIEVINSSTKK